MTKAEVSKDAWSGRLVLGRVEDIRTATLTVPVLSSQRVRIASIARISGLEAKGCHCMPHGNPGTSSIDYSDEAANFSVRPQVLRGNSA